MTHEEKKKIADEVIKLIVSKNVSLHDFRLILKLAEDFAGDLILKEKESVDS